MRDTIRKPDFLLLASVFFYTMIYLAKVRPVVNTRMVD